MKLEDQNVSLDLAKELRERGVNQNSIFGWYQYEGYDPYIEYKELEERAHVERMAIEGYSEDPTLLCSAHTVAELGENLPIFTSSSKIIGFPSLGWRCVLEIPISKIHYEEAQTEANARAKMVIYLLKEGLLKAEEVGK